MECRTPTGKRALSTTEPTSSPERKKMKSSSNKPVLRLDCRVSPGPQPMPYPSALPFPSDSNSVSTGSLDCSAGFYEHQSYSQSSYSQQAYSQQPPRLPPRNYQPPYYRTPNYQSSNYQPPNYLPPNYPFPNCQHLNYQSTPVWEEFVGKYQPACNANFMDMCQTSEAEASCSVYSSFPNRGGLIKDIPYAASTYASTPLPKKDDCKAFILVLFERLSSIKDTLATGQSTIEELIRLAPLLSYSK
jgi:hypothetical protein